MCKNFVTGVVATVLFIFTVSASVVSLAEVTASERMNQLLTEILEANANNDKERVAMLSKEMEALGPRVRAEQKANLEKLQKNNPSTFAQDLQNKARQIEAQAETPEWKISLAARKGDLVAVKQLRAAGTEINFYRLDPAPPLMEAAMNGHVEVAEYLLREGATLRIQKSLVTLDALHLAVEAKEDNSPMINLLVKNGALEQGDIENLGSAMLKDSEQQGQHHAQMEGKQLTSGSALMAAIEKNKTIHTRTLLKLGANPNAWAFGKSALMLAASKLNVEVVDMLLVQGADVNAAGPQGKTAVEFAESIPKTIANTARRNAVIARLKEG
jgi:ankyrin repeat protein